MSSVVKDDMIIDIVLEQRACCLTRKIQYLTSAFEMRSFIVRLTNKEIADMSVNLSS